MTNNMTNDTHCLNPLGMENHGIPSHGLYVTSVLYQNTDQYGKERGRLNNPLPTNIFVNAWIPGTSDSDPHYDVDMSKNMLVGGLMTRGCYKFNSFVREFKVLYDVDGGQGHQTLTDANGYILTYGNIDSFIIVTHTFSNIILARHLRIAIIKTSCKTYCSISFEILGCQYQ
ncbi:lactadherin-like [Amphiura filiformis]|uniref:lactadherin-like n=1 Tax=Amphiura filiformis TaxID=82378 RepID=UPI003B213C28